MGFGSIAFLLPLTLGRPVDGQSILNGVLARFDSAASVYCATESVYKNQGKRNRSYIKLWLKKPKSGRMEQSDAPNEAPNFVSTWDGKRSDMILHRTKSYHNL